MVNSCLNYVPARVVSGSVSPGCSGRVRLELEKEITWLEGSRIVLLDPGQKRPRVFGYGVV